MKSCPTCQTSYPNNYVVCPQDGGALKEIELWAADAVIRGKYRILGKVGQGGMGAVYKAVHVAFDELRALKVITPELMADELFVKRFKHEAVITRKLQHPNAVRVDDIDEAEDGRPFIVMEYIEGQSLKNLIQTQGALPVPRVCSIVKQAAAALEAAHRLGMVHRDIKPDNIVLIETPQGEHAKVLDFGIAKIKEGRLKDTGSMTLTGTGVVIGTPQYMSPEQAMGKRGDELDGRSDLYSLGVVMYQMLSGDLPFKADTTMEMLLAHMQRPPAPIQLLHPELPIPEAVARVVMKTLEKKPADRPASAGELIKEIEKAEKTAAVLGETRVVTPKAFFAPEAAQSLRESLRAAPERPGRGAAPPIGGSSSEAPAVPQAPSSMARKPAPAPQPLRAAPPATAKSSNWGLWAAVGILAVGLVGGGWYVVLRHSAPESPIQTPSPTGPPAGKTTTAPTSSPSNMPPKSSPRPSETNSSTPASQGESSTGLVPPPATAQKSPRTERKTLPFPQHRVDSKALAQHVALGDFYLKRGDYDNAIAEYQKGQDLDPSNKTLQEKIAKARRAKEAEQRFRPH